MKMEKKRGREIKIKETCENGRGEVGEQLEESKREKKITTKEK